VKMPWVPSSAQFRALANLSDVTDTARPAPSAMPFGMALGQRSLVMGILNVTPDSFSDGGAWDKTDIAVTHGHGMALAGADIIDIGGESTRPGFQPITAQDEMARVLPVITRLKQDGLAAPLSIDTMKASVALAAVGAGASIVNDIHGLQGDAEMAGVVAASGAGLVAMYHRATIDDEIDIIMEMHRFFSTTLEIAAKAGIDQARMMLDPGVGFGKSHRQNLILIGHCRKLKAEFGLPVLLGTSRKSFIGRIVAGATDQRLPGSLASIVLGAADAVRVHDVAETVQAMRVADAIRHEMEA
jgi:dihydropteroate synthase